MTKIENDKLETYDYSFVGRVSTSVSINATNEKDAFKLAHAQVMKEKWTGEEIDFDTDEIYLDDVRRCEMTTLNCNICNVAFDVEENTESTYADNEGNNICDGCR